MSATGGRPQRGRRDNGLDAGVFVAVADVDPRIGEHLLDVLGIVGIAAYLTPSADLNPVVRATTLPSRPTDRLWVDRERVDEARGLLEAVQEDDAAGPAGSTPDGFDVDAEWERIVAGFDATAHRPGRPAGADPGDPARAAAHADSPDGTAGTGHGAGEATRDVLDRDVLDRDVLDRDVLDSDAPGGDALGRGGAVVDADGTGDASEGLDRSGRADGHDRDGRDPARVDRDGRAPRAGRAESADLPRAAAPPGPTDLAGTGADRVVLPPAAVVETSGAESAPVADAADPTGPTAATSPTDDEGYSPPPPPPLPRLSGQVAVALLAIAAGVVLFFRPGTLGLDTDLAMVLGLLGVLGGAAALVYRLRDGWSDDDPDDGAVV